MTAARLSVVVPTRDTRPLTLRCLETVAVAAVPGLECIVVDDGSTDGTAAAVCRRFPSTVVVSLAPSRGFSAAANRGIAAATGGLLLVLNSDTELAPDALRRLLDAFDGDPALGAAGAALRFPDGRPQWSGGPTPGPAWLFASASGVAPALARLPGWRSLRPAGAGVDWVSGAALAIRRAAWVAAGPFDETFRFYCQDLDLCLRIGDAGWGVEVLDAVRVVHHGGATIGRAGGVAGPGYVPELLWTDLVRWAGKHRGPAGARQALRTLVLGGTLRIAARRVARPLVRSARRAVWERDTRAFARALAALRALQASPA